MKSFLRNLFLSVTGLVLATSAATAAPWPPAAGDLILGVQATGGTGSTTNVFFNLGPAHALRTSPSPGTLADLSAELTAAYGAAWATRTDLYFGVFANRTNQPPSGIGAVAPANGDPGRTIYTSKGAVTPGTTTPWSGYSTAALAIPATAHSGQISALAVITANGNQVATLSQSSNPVQWENGWSEYNPTPGAAYNTFGGGIQALINSTAAHVDVYRILGTTGNGTYVTTVSLSGAGVLSATAAGAPTTYFTVTGTASNGTIAGADGVTLYANGSNARLTATPATGFGFVGWSGDASGSANPLNLPINANKAVTATFAPFPSITSPTATAITDLTATLGANVTSDGGQTLTERGVVYAELADSANPILGGSNVLNVTASGTTGVFTAPVAALTAGTTYAYKGYATSSAGTGYSALAFFTTDTEVTLTSGIGTVTDRAIQAGDSQGFRFTIGDASNVNFTTTGLTTATWELRDAGNALVSSGTGNVAFSNLLGSGDYFLELTNTGGSAETYALTLDASDEASAQPAVRATPPRITSAKARPVKGRASVSNTGDLPSAITVRGTKGNVFFKVTYTGPGGNITAGVTSGTFQTAVLSNVSAPVTVNASIVPNKRKLVKKVGKRMVTLKKTFNGVYTASAAGATSATARFSVSVK